MVDNTLFTKKISSNLIIVQYSVRGDDYTELGLDLSMGRGVMIGDDASQPHGGAVTRISEMRQIWVDGGAVTYSFSTHTHTGTLRSALCLVPDSTRAPKTSHLKAVSIYLGYIKGNYARLTGLWDPIMDRVTMLDFDILFSDRNKIALLNPLELEAE
ncbi:hypothetical protein Tco_0522113 [Tanacetum coccineum]